MGVYYPQGAVVLRIRWEDFGKKDKDKLKSEYIHRVLSKNFRVNINDYTQADTFECSFDYRELPIDPRLIRACGVTIHLEDRKKLFQANNDLNTITLDEKNTIFLGFADTDKIELNEDDKTIRLEGRDLTALLIDTPWFGDPIPLTDPIHMIMRRILDSSEQTKQMKLLVKLSDTDALIPTGTSKELAHTILTRAKVPTGDLPTLANLGSDLSSQAGQKNVGRNDSQWEIISELAAKAGLIAYVSLDKLVLTKPRNLYNRSKAKVFIYGNNLKSLEFERKLGRQKGFNVRVVSLDLTTKTLVTADIPREASDEWSKALGIVKKDITVPKPMPPGSQPTTSQPANTVPGKTETSPATTVPSGEDVAPFLTFRVADISNKEHLVRIGEKVFEELGRQQIEGNLESEEMVITDRSKQDFDVTKFDIGAPIDVLIDGLDLAGIKKVNKAENRIPILISKGFKREVAAVMAEVIEKIDTPFYTKDIELTLDQNNGFNLKIGFINFIELPQAILK